MVAHLTLLSCATADSSPSVVLATEKERFLFNVGEGTQRLCCEHKMRLSRAAHVLVTHLREETIAGLPGLLLTVADAGRKNVTLHGPPGLSQFIHATRFFMRRPELAITCQEGETPPIVTSELTVHKILAISGEVGKGGRMSAISFMAEFPPTPGKFFVEKAIALGVPAGPLRGKLKSGEKISLENGVVVSPEDVLGPATPGTAAAVIGCPKACLVLPLISHPIWDRWRRGTDGEGGVEKGDMSPARLKVMVHYGPVEVVCSENYQQWCDGWGGDVKHIYAGRGCTSSHSPYVASFTNSIKLNRLCPELYKVPLQEFTEDEGRVHDRDGRPLVTVPSTSPLCCYIVSPPHQARYDDSSSIGRDRLWQLAEKRAKDDWETAFAHDSVGFQCDIQTARMVAEGRNNGKPVNNNTSPLDHKGEEEGGISELKLSVGVELAFLGTGSAQPSKYRNVSGIYLRLSKNGAGMLLDAGEGSLGQMWRLFGSEGGDEKGEGVTGVLKGLQVIWISHPHADHHLGLQRVLSERKRLFPCLDPPVVIAPLCIHRWLCECVTFLGEGSSTNDTGVDYCSPGEGFFYTFVNSEDMKSPICVPLPLVSVLQRMGIEQCWNIPVPHCQDSYALILKAIAGWKLVYSGDTRPYEGLIKAGMGATVLIHEATFDDTMQGEALSRMHSTTSEAVEVGRKMRAYRTILTHFSQRYPKLPLLQTLQQEGVKQNYASVCIAFDFMRCSLMDLEWAPLTIPGLQRLFPPDGEDENDNKPSSQVEVVESKSKSKKKAIVTSPSLTSHKQKKHKGFQKAEREG
eukprot:417062_1